MKTLISKILMLLILIVMVSCLGSFLVSCKGMFATSEDGKPLVIYGPLPEPKEPAQEMPPPKQEKTK